MGDMLVFAGVGFFHGGGFFEPGELLCFCHLLHPEKRSIYGETNQCMGYFFGQILHLPQMNSEFVQVQAVG